MRRKEVEKQLGVNSTTLRYYEREGLLNPYKNEQNNYREYVEEDLERIKQIKMLRMLGISISDIKNFLNGSIELEVIVKAQLEDIKRKEEELKAAEKVCKKIIDYSINAKQLSEELFSDSVEIWKKKIEEMQVKQVVERIQYVVSIALSVLIIVCSFYPLSWIGQTGDTDNQILILCGDNRNFVSACLILHVLIPITYFIHLTKIIDGKSLIVRNGTIVVIGRIITLLEVGCFIFTPYVLIRYCLVELEGYIACQGKDVIEQIVKKGNTKAQKIKG